LLFRDHIQIRGDEVWEPHSISFTGHDKKSQPERRAINRVHTAIPVTIKVVGVPGSPPAVTVHTADISPQGLSTVITIRILKVKNGLVSLQEQVKNSARMIKHLIAQDRILGLGIHILPQGGCINAMGTVRWHIRRLHEGLYSVRAGILLNEIDRAHKREWFVFLRAIYEHLVCFQHEMDGPLSPN
jgi:hypothetical protein